VTPEELFLEWGAAWATRDPVEKEKRLRGCCTEDVEFIPPDDRPVFRGIDAVLAHVVSYTADWPAGSAARLARPPDTHHDWSRGLMVWERPPRVNQGTDIIRVRDGRIAAMLVFRDSPDS
jgi:hypothetical protein